MKSFFCKLKNSINNFMKKLSITPFQIVVFSAVLIFLILILLKVEIILALITAVFYVLIIMSLQKGKLNIFFFFFIMSFFIFLVSGDLFEQLFGELYWIRFSKEANLHAHVCILISAVSMGIAYYFLPSSVLTKIKPLNSKSKLLKNEINASSSSQNNTISKIGDIKFVRYTALVLFTIAFIILAINTVHKIIWVSNYGYVQSYLDYKPLLPSLISEFGDMAFVLLIIYLATMPERKYCVIPLVLWLLYVCSSLLTGGRSTFIYGVVFVIAYVVYRNNHYSYGKVWIPKKLIIIFIALTPLLLIFLKVYEYLRVGFDAPEDSLWTTFIRFFVDIGSSSKVIKYGYDYKDVISDHFKFFSLGEIINYFKYSPIFNWFNQAPPLHSIEYANEGHSFAHYISYLVMPNDFLNGHGTGSSFIAILFADFGYVGVALGSVIYGLFFKQWLNFDKLNWVGKTMIFYASYELLLAPRGAYDSFLAILFNVKFILLIVAVWVSSLIVGKYLLNKRDVEND